ncbi:phosphodiesterase [Arthrobacter agilis]|uniref:phosphodiesterase n=1 Tax=Arthrobacter agilis TaxID=37921 RepID=UPI002789DCC9|nr:phosphodiesterase [Arthrobacter agilis]MDQ0737044.1 Icc protein [Arthrobacter agilis]
MSREHPPADHLLFHFSDTHFMADGLLYGGVDARGRLAQLLAEIGGSGVRPDALIFTGDLTDKGDPDAYATLRELVEPFADTLGAPVIWLMGNHDRRSALRVALLGEPPEDTPLYRSYRLGGLRVIALDTSVPGHHHGEIDDVQLAWLAAELSRPAPEGSILALHHPPIPMVQDLAVLTELRRQDRLAEVVAGTDIRLILAGHVHFPSSSLFAGIPVSVASSTCYTQDLNVPEGGIRGRDGAQGFNLVHVYPHTVVSSVATIGSYPTVGQYVAPEEARRRLAAAQEVSPTRH